MEYVVFARWVCAITNCLCGLSGLCNLLVHFFDSLKPVPVAQAVAHQPLKWHPSRFTNVIIGYPLYVFRSGTLSCLEPFSFIFEFRMPAAQWLPPSLFASVALCYVILTMSCMRSSGTSMPAATVCHDRCCLVLVVDIVHQAASMWQ